MKWCVSLKMYKDVVLSEVKLKNMSEAYASLCDLNPSFLWIKQHPPPIIAFYFSIFERNATLSH